MTTAANPEQVRSFLDRRIVSPSALAQRANLHANTLRGCKLPSWNPKYKTLEALGAAMAEIDAEQSGDNIANLPQNLRSASDASGSHARRQARE